jgi:hypothetical protein
MQPRLKVRRPDELLAMIPYLIGFHPDESLVAVYVRSGRVILTTRSDLPEQPSADAVAEQIDALAKREKADALALVAYSAAALPAHRLLTRLMDQLGGHRLTDVLYVGHARWWSLTCGDECCPLEGTPLDLTSHPLSAAAVLAGLGARASRRELEEAVSGPAIVDMPRLEALAETLLGELEQLDDADQLVRLTAGTIAAAMTDPDAVDERNSLRLGLLVMDLHLRDLAWSLISPATADDHVRLWGAVVARIPPRFAAAPLCLLGMAAWVGGAGALLNCCCERLAEVAPDYSMGRLLTEISAQALPPSLWHQLGGDVPANLRAELALLTE